MSVDIFVAECDDCHWRRSGSELKADKAAINHESVEDHSTKVRKEVLSFD